jgi:hypothetical protein
MIAVPLEVEALLFKAFITINSQNISNIAD